VSAAGSSLPPWLIAADDVDAWLDGSVIQQSLVHVTDPADARAMREAGIDVTRPSTGVCDGFYCSDRAWAPLARPGKEVLSVAVRMVNPFRTQSPLAIRVDLAKLTGDPSWRPSDQVRRELLSYGYDGVITEESGAFQSDGPVFIALLEGTARIVVSL
jgi:hypothetical protein